MSEPKPKYLLGGTPGSIKRLRRFYKTGVLDPTKIFSELYGESDRSAVISSLRPCAAHFRSSPINGHHPTGPVGPVRLMGAIVDRVLILRLEKHLCFKPDQDDLDYIFRFEGSLGTFSARMEVACLFGFIDDDTYQQLDIMRELRNACAHSMHPTVFSDPVVANVVRRLFRPLGLFADPASDTKELKKSFLLEGMFVIGCLVKNSRTEATEWISSLLIDAGVKPSPDKAD